MLGGAPIEVACCGNYTIASEGSGAVLDAEGASRLVAIDSALLSVWNLRLVNGQMLADGGGVVLDNDASLAMH